MKVKKAVIPAAGLGTRFLPATKAIPKEMIPIIDKPMIQYIVEEMAAAGIEEIIFAGNDHSQGDKELARSLGFEKDYAGMTPQEEDRLIHRFHKDGRKIAIISDGRNESSSKADVFISLDHLLNVDTNKADIILHKTGFLKLPLVWNISKNLRNNTNRTVGLIAVPNTICICGAMFGVLGFVQTLILNSSCNFMATLSNSIPLYRTYEEELQQEYRDKRN